MGIRQIIKSAAIELNDKRIRVEKRRKAIKKFQDKRRVDIFSKVTLTREQENGINKLFEENYGEKIPFTWHRHFSAFTGNFDERFFPELLFIPEFEYFMNMDSAYVTAYDNKNLLPFIAKGAGVKSPEVVLSCTSGMYRNSQYEMVSKEVAVEMLSNAGEVFIKPTVSTGSGVGCFLADFSDGQDNKSAQTAEEIIKNMGTNFVVQRRLQCHDTIATLYADSVNTFRVITYRWKDSVFHTPILMRIGQGGKALDNAHAGGMFIAVDDDGGLHEKAFTEFGNSFTQHPDTGVVFAEYKIPLLPKVIAAAERMHQAAPQVGVVNWDFTLDQDGEPVLIEANNYGGSIWLPQIAHGKGAFGERTAEILRWLRVMKKTPVSERWKYNFGTNVD